MIAPQRCQVALKKRPSEYLKQIYVDSMVFSTEGLRHLAAVCGPGQIVIGTDDPVGWVPDSPVDPILATPGLSDADKTAMVGGTARKLLNIPAYCCELIVAVESCGAAFLEETDCCRRPKLQGGLSLYQYCSGSLLSSLLDHFQEGNSRTGQMPVAPVDDAQFPPQLDVLDGNQLDSARTHIIVRKTLANEGYAQIGANEAFDHGDAGQLHDDAELGTVRPKKLVKACRV